MKKEIIAVSVAGLAGCIILSAAWAAVEERTIVIRDHRFEPSEVAIPADTKVRLVIDNQDPTAEEFESYELNREKVIPGKSKAPVFVGPLKPGRYPFFGEFNQATAQGVLVVGPAEQGGK